MQQPKKKWTKPVIEPLDVPDLFDPAGGMTYQKWKACKDLQEKRAEWLSEDAEKRRPA